MRPRFDDHAGTVVITVAFIGYLVAGASESDGGRGGVFLPVYLFVILRPAPSVRAEPRYAFVDGVTAAATGASPAPGSSWVTRHLDVGAAIICIAAFAILAKTGGSPNRSSSLLPASWDYKGSRA
jgi:chromate transporter